MLKYLSNLISEDNDTENSINESGYSIYLWDMLLGLSAVAIYTLLFNGICNIFPLLGTVLNYVISYFGLMAVYCLIIVSIRGEDNYFLPLLNNKMVNDIMNYILIGLLAIIPWRKREEYLQ